MDLFIDSTLAFEKSSSEASLPEDPNAWPQEILQELFKQVPYISDFDPHVMMARVDAEQGFGFGHVEVMNKTELKQSLGTEDMKASGVRQARIPVIIRNRKLQPFDVIITEDSQMLPLTEMRLRQAIFRPQAFDMTAKTPGDMSMIGQLYPPYRQSGGFGGGGQTVDASMGKMGSLLGAILPTINQSDYNAFFDKLADTSLQAAFVKNGSASGEALETLAGYEPVGPEKTAAALFDSVPPTVVQVRREDQGYVVKTASRHFWAPRERIWDRLQVVQELGEKVALDADMAGSVTMADEPGAGAPPAEAAPGAAPVAPQDTEEDRYELIKDFGSYKVKTEDGQELTGIVFPNLIDLDGRALPLYLFTNGSQAATQAEIVGVYMGPANSLPEGGPRGHGCFYEVLTNGKAQATVPLTIEAEVSMPDEENGASPGVSLHATSFDGREVEVKVQPDITKLVASEGSLLVPETMRWLPLDGAEEVVLVGEPEQAEVQDKQANVYRAVQIRASGVDGFSFAGLPVEKLAREERSFLDLDGALFLLGGLGVDLTRGTEKLARALRGGEPVEVLAGHGLALPAEKIAEAQKLASARLDKVPNLRVSLIKEAAVIPDPTAVDTVLSLGFINPENVTTFISYLPNLDEAQKKMCELLVAARLGLKDIPVSALERSIRSTEDVIEGLRVMAFQEN